MKLVLLSLEPAHPYAVLWLGDRVCGWCLPPPAVDPPAMLVQNTVESSDLVEGSPGSLTAAPPSVAVTF